METTLPPDVAAAFVAACSEIKNAKKDANNTFHKAKYSTLVSVLDAIKESFHTHGFVISQAPGAIDGNLLSISTCFVHTSGFVIESKSFIPLKDVTPQGFGSALTYGRRYALTALVGIAAIDDDDDAEKAQGRQPVIPTFDVTWNKDEPPTGVPGNLFVETVKRVTEFGEKAMPGYKKEFLDRNKATLRAFWKLDKAAAESLHSHLNGTVS